MQRTYEIMKSVLRCLNYRVPSMDDALGCADKGNVQVRFIPDMGTDDGYYVPASKSPTGKAYIIINASLPEREQIKTLIHELTHHFCHSALNLVLVSRRSLTEEDFMAKQQRWIREKHEREADAIAAIAMIPECDLKHASMSLFDPADIATQEIWMIRLYVRENFGK